MKYALNRIGATKYFSVKLVYTKAVVLLLQTYNLFVFNAYNSSLISPGIAAKSALQK